MPSNNILFLLLLQSESSYRRECENTASSNIIIECKKSLEKKFLSTLGYKSCINRYLLNDTLQFSL